MSAAVYDWILRCCWFYVSTDSVCFSRFATCCPASVLAGLQSAMLCVTAFLQSADCRRGRSSAPGSKNHRTALYCRQAFLVAAVRKSASEVPLRFIDVLRYAPDIVRSQPRTASLFSGNSVLLLSSNQAGRLRRGCLILFQRFCVGRARGEPSAELPAARVRRRRLSGSLTAEEVVRHRSSPF